MKPKPVSKFCNHCLADKLHEYRTDRRQKSGYLVKEKCIDCMVLYYRERRPNISKRVHAIKKQCIEYLGGKCQLCGLQDECIAIYDFHHRNPKEKDFTIQTRKHCSFDNLKPEIDKCDLLCANCHRRQHYKATKNPCSLF